jgi:hypothetical protein
MDWTARRPLAIILVQTVEELVVSAASTGSGSVEPQELPSCLLISEDVACYYDSTS